MKKPSAFLVAALCFILLAALTAKTKSSVLAEEQKPESYTLVMYIGSGEAYINGVKTPIVTDGENGAPYVKEGSVFVPARFIGEAFKLAVTWDEAGRTARFDSESRLVSVKVGEDLLTVTSDGIANKIPMSQRAEIVNDRVYVPLRSIAEALGKGVFYERGLIVINDKVSLDKDKDKTFIDGLIASFTGLQRVGSEEKLDELLKENGFITENAGYGVNGAKDGGFIDDMAFPEEAAIEAPTAPPAPVPQSADEGDAGGGTSGGAGSTSTAVNRDTASIAQTESEYESDGDYSTTNKQVGGVDEADIIKTDGQYIYYVRNGAIAIVKSGADLELMSQISVDKDFSFNEIFVDKDKIVAIGTEYSAGEGRLAYGYIPYNPYTKAVVYDVADKRNPKEERTVVIDGSYASSRKIGQSVYFVSTYYPHYYNPKEPFMLPAYSDSAVSKGEIAISYNDICYLPVIRNPNLTSIVGFNIDKPKEKANIETILGVDSSIYMSENNLYIAGTTYEDNQNNTDIYKFSISKGEIVYQGSGVVPGMIINQFSMDEYAGYFRIGTTVDSYGRGQSETSNCLYVLDSSLKIAGKVLGIAQGERIYSVRFMGDRAYMVTFKQVDPLFVIDLKSPENPKIMGALKIPGYSNYLHPYDENHLIGFGKDTTVDSYGNAFYLGMKISLFDITDITNPKEKFVEYIGDRGTESLLLNNHKALMFSKERGIMAFPVTLFETAKARSRNGDLEYGQFVTNAAYVYDISVSDGFKLRGDISHLTDEDLIKSSSWGGSEDKYIERIIYIGDTLYTASPNMIKSSDITSLKEIDKLLLP